MIENNTILTLELNKYAELGLKAELIYWEKRDGSFKITPKNLNIDEVGYKKDKKIYFDGKKLFIWTNPNNCILGISGYLKSGETIENLLKIYPILRPNMMLRKYYTEEEILNGEYSEVLTYCSLINNNNFEIEIDENRFWNEAVQVHYVFYGNLKIIIWEKREQKIIKNILSF